MKNHAKYLYQLRILKRKERKRLKRQYRNIPKIMQDYQIPFRGKQDFQNNPKLGPRHIKLNAPNIFSFIENSGETIAFFNELQALISDRQPIFMNLEGVTKITPDSLLYFLSIFNSMKEKRVFISIRANRPKDLKCRHFIEQSGFYNHTDTNNKPNHTDKNIFEIITGNNSETDIIKPIKYFCLEKLDLDRFSAKGRAIWANLVEATANTNNHAYKKNHNTFFLNQWWVLATHHKDRVILTFLDNGKGIPKTLKKRILSKQHTDNDSTLIHKALKGGVIRSATGKNYRNRGLPKVLDIVTKSKLVDKLTIISDKGFLEITHKSLKLNETNYSFKGTLLQWEIS